MKYTNTNLCLLLILMPYKWQTYGLPDWKDHDTSTLKLINIVHRHGERSPISFSPNDPFKNITQFWSEGLEQLSIQGKYRMYKLGEFIRKEYGTFLGNNYSPREVYARSSIEHRCIESVACVLAAAYPPNNAKWKWNKGSDGDINLGVNWQPFPIETFMPKDNDTLLVPNKHCPNVDRDFRNVMSNDLITHFLTNQSEFINYISDIVGERIDTIHKAERLWDTIDIETDRGYVWTSNWTLEQQKQIVSKLREFTILTFQYDWSTELIKRVRVGELIKTLAANMQSVIDNQNNGIKLYLYSTHDSIVTPLLQALEVYNDVNPPFGAAVIFELHQNFTNDYFVRVYYFNETLRSLPYALRMEKCGSGLNCDFNQFRDLAKFWFYDEFDEICGTKTNLLMAQLPYYAICLCIGALIGIVWFVSISAICKSVRNKKFVLNHETS